jgi:hypothetical protein
MVRQLACRKTWGKSKVKRDVRCWTGFSNFRGNTFSSVPTSKSYH